MSVTDNPAPALDHGSGPGQGKGRPLFRRPPFVLGVLAVLVAAIAGGVIWTVTKDDGPDPAKIARTAPITLPATISGLQAAPADADFAGQPIWKAAAAKAAPGVTIEGHSYGSAKERRQIRVVAGRADLTGKLEFTWAADAGHEVKSAQGKAHCTRNLRLVARAAAVNRPTMMFCWRTEKALSAYGVVIDFDHDPTDSEAVTALDAAWKAALTGH